MLLISLAISVGSAQAAIYRSVDAQGNVVFSDQPGGDAQRIDLPPVPTYSPPTLPPPAPPSQVTPSAPAGPGYQQFSVLAPTQDQAFWDNSGNVEVTLTLEPALMTGLGHRIIYYLDGSADGEATEQTSMVFHNVERGEHSVSATLVDADGQTVVSTGTVRFQVHRQSLTSPLRKSSPAPAPNPKPK